MELYLIYIYQYLFCHLISIFSTGKSIDFTLHNRFYICALVYKLDFTYMWNLESKINEQTKQKQTHRHREQTSGCQRGRGLEGWVRKEKGLRTTNW